MEKYGFVYIWYDRKHKKYYIGSHWGSVDDGYICSSTWMRNAYKYRKEDFKRKIIARVFSSKSDLLKKEYEFLSLIKEEELGKKYYNMSNHLNGHWFTDEERAKTLSDRISIKTKEAMQRPEVREKYLKGLKNRPKPSAQTVEKRRQSMIKTMAEKFPVENRYNPVKFGSEEYRLNMAKSVSESWKTRDKETIGNKISESLSGKPKTGKAAKGHRKTEERNKKASESIKIVLSSNPDKTTKGKLWWNNGTINTRSKDSPGPGWVKGKLPHNKSYNSEKMKEIWALRKAGKLPMPDYGN